MTTLFLQNWIDSNLDLLFVKDLRFDRGKLDVTYILEQVNTKTDIWAEIFQVKNSLSKYSTILSGFQDQIIRSKNDMTHIGLSRKQITWTTKEVYNEHIENIFVIVLKFGDVLIQLISNVCSYCKKKSFVSLHFHIILLTITIFMSLEILPLEKIFYHRCGLMMYKYHNNLLPCSISQLYAKNDSIHDHNTRCSNLLRVPIGSKSFTSVSARIWNVLNNIIVFDVPISKFKSLLKQYLLYNFLTLTYSK